MIWAHGGLSLQVSSCVATLDTSSSLSSTLAKNTHKDNSITWSPLLSTTDSILPCSCGYLECL